MTATTALLLFLNDIEDVSDEAYTAWHRDHHVPQRLTVPGILAAHRYALQKGGGRRFLTIYELAAGEVLSHPSYLSLIEHPDAPTAAMRTHLKGGIRIVIRLDRAPAGPPPTLVAVDDAAASGLAWAAGPCEQPASAHPLAAAANLPDRLSLVGPAPHRRSAGDGIGAVPRPWAGDYRWLDTQATRS